MAFVWLGGLLAFVLSQAIRKKVGLRPLQFAFGLPVRPCRVEHASDWSHYGLVAECRVGIEAGGWAGLRSM